jgi:hypothetical protein
MLDLCDFGNSEFTTINCVLHNIADSDLHFLNLGKRQAHISQLNSVKVKVKHTCQWKNFLSVLVKAKVRQIVEE